MLSKTNIILSDYKAKSKFVRYAIHILVNFFYFFILLLFFEYKQNVFTFICIMKENKIK